jgi:hypothetical protein
MLDYLFSDYAKRFLWLLHKKMFTRFMLNFFLRSEFMKGKDKLKT